MFKFSSSLVVLTAAALGGCAITQTATPVAQVEGREICVIVNPAVSQPGFLQTYSRVLLEKGYMVKQLQAGSAITDCPVTSTYTANWRWDLALYLAFVDIKVFKKGEPAGQVVYDSTKGGANMNKFVRGDEKIAELVNQLFPGRAVVAPAGAAMPPAGAASS